jgi:hypothetical protein
MRNEELFALKKSFHEQAAATRSRTAVAQIEFIEDARTATKGTRVFLDCAVIKSRAKSLGKK